MARPLRVALFAEGSGESSASRYERGALAWTWSDILPRGLGCTSQVHVVPFSKGDLVALDPLRPKSAGAIALDKIIQKTLTKDPTLQSVLIAWDLQPPWDPDAKRCRWQETLDVYRLLGASEHLQNPWRAHALARYGELSRRRIPSARSGPHRLMPGEIGVLCMEPMFEALLIDEPAIFRVLGLVSRPKKWPARVAWKRMGRTPDRTLLKPAIEVARESKTRARIVDQIDGDMETRKNEWGAHILASLFADRAARTRLLDRPLAVRLAEVLP